VPRGPAWSEEDIKFLKANYALSDELLAEKLGRSWSGVKNMRQKIGAAKSRGRKRLNPEKVIVRPCGKWSPDDLDFVLETMDKSINEVAAALNRTVSSVQNARIRVKREHGLEVRTCVRNNPDQVPKQELWELPPGIYEKMVGRILLDNEEIMGHWMHAHGFSSFEIVDEDSRGWITLACVKVR
jgi:hypothetical protein